MWLDQFGNCTEGSLSPSRSRICGAKKAKDAALHRLVHLGARLYSPIAVVGLQHAHLKRGISRGLDLFGGKGILCSLPAPQMGLEPKESGARTGAAIFRGKRLKAVRMTTANLCSSICSLQCSWMLGPGSDSMLARKALEETLPFPYISMSNPLLHIN